MGLGKIVMMILVVMVNFGRGGLVIDFVVFGFFNILEVFRS